MIKLSDLEKHKWHSRASEFKGFAIYLYLRLTKKHIGSNFFEKIQSGEYDNLLRKIYPRLMQAIDKSA